MGNNTTPGGDQDNKHRPLRLVASQLDNPRRFDEQWREYTDDKDNRRSAREHGHNRMPIAPMRRNPGREPKETVEQQRRRERGEDVTPRRRSKRERQQFELIKEQIRRLKRMDDHPVNEHEIEELALAYWEEEKQKHSRRPAPENEMVDLQERAERERPGDHRLIGQAAVRRTRAGRSMTERLMGAIRSVGAPAQHKLATAVIELMIHGGGRIVQRYAYQDLACASLEMVEWAYDSPANTRPERAGLDTSRPLSESAVRDAVNGYHRKDRKTGERKSYPGILDRVDPSFLKDELFETYLDLRGTGYYPNMGRAFSIDGTMTPTRLLQTQSVSAGHERAINGKMADEDCAFGYHGPDKAVRGFNGLFACDPHGPVFAAAAQLLAARDDEGTAALQLVRDVMTRVHERADRDGVFPLPDLAYVIGDKAFSRPDVCRALVFEYGLHPVFPFKKDNSTAKWASNKGVPVCELHEVEMRYREHGGFIGPVRRWELGLKPGDDLSDLIRRTPGMRAPYVSYKCPRKDCKRVTKLSVERAPHIYTYLPHKDVHCPDRTHNKFTARQDLLANRNASESLNSGMKYDCWGLGGAAATGGVSSKRQMEWYTYGRLLSQGLRRLVTADGTYDTAYSEAEKYGLTRPGSFERNKAAFDSQEDGLLGPNAAHVA